MTISTTLSQSDLQAAAIAQIAANAANEEALINQLDQLASEAVKWEVFLARLPANGASQAEFDAVGGKLTDLKNQIKSIESQLEAIDPSFSALDGAINGILQNAFEAGTWAQSGDSSFFGGGAGGDDLNQDIPMFISQIQKICTAMQYKAKVTEYANKIGQDGDNSGQMAKDAADMIKASADEQSTLIDLRQSLADEINDRFNGGGLRDVNDLIAYNTRTLAALSPEFASVQNQVYAVASLQLDRLLKKVLATILDQTLTPQQKSNAIKYEMAFALGILSLIQTETAETKAENNQTIAKGNATAAEGNLVNQKAEAKKLQDELKQAAEMKTMMAIVKPMLEVMGTLLAPGLGTFLVMAALTIADNTGLLDKLTNSIATATGNQAAADAIVGAIEIVMTVGGGAAMDAAIKAATEQAAKAVAKDVATVVNQVVEETVQAAISSAGTPLNEVAVRAVVKEAVEGAVEQAAKKAVMQANKQSMTAILSSAWENGGLTGLAKATQKTAVTAAEDAAKIAAKNIQPLAEKTALKAGSVAAEDVQEVSYKAANEAVAKMTKSTAESVAKSTAERSSVYKGVTRGITVATYNALESGAASNALEAILKKYGKDDDNSWKTLLSIIKVIEGILASITVAAGTGIAQNLVANNGGEAVLTNLANSIQLAGQGASTFATAGKANVDIKQADTQEKLSTISASDGLLQNLQNQQDQAKKVDDEHFVNQMAELASNYTVFAQLFKNEEAAARILAQPA